MFKKAERKRVKLKIAVTGPSGSGKTFSALRLASGIGKKIAYIDTENGSASLYSEKFDFDVVDLVPPFDVQKFTAAINAAEKANYDVIVIDSISHIWAGEGGLLDQKANLDSRPGSNNFANWNPINKKENEFKNAFLHSSSHIICAMRSKMAYEQNKDEKGKTKIEKLGLAPIQREGIEYEFTTVFDIDMNHKATVSKDRTEMFVDTYFQITEDIGRKFVQWLESGANISEMPVIVSSQPEPNIVPSKQTPIATENKSEIAPRPIPSIVLPVILKKKIPHGARFRGLAYGEIESSNLIKFAEDVLKSLHGIPPSGTAKEFLDDMDQIKNIFAGPNKNINSRDLS